MTLSCAAYYCTETNLPCHARANVDFGTLEEAQAFAASFPKSLGLKVGQGVSLKGRYAQVYFDVSFSAIKGNGKNETGIKRVRKLLADPRVVFVKGYAQNAYETAEEFLAAL